jgi:hypothetical protein
MSPFEHVRLSVAVHIGKCNHLGIGLRNPEVVRRQPAASRPASLMPLALDFMAQRNLGRQQGRQGPGGATLIASW